MKKLALILLLMTGPASAEGEHITFVPSVRGMLEACSEARPSYCDGVIDGIMQMHEFYYAPKSGSFFCPHSGWSTQDARPTIRNVLRKVAKTHPNAPSTPAIMEGLRQAFPCT